MKRSPRRNRWLRASVSINDRSFLPSLVRMTSPLACTIIPKNRYQTIKEELLEAGAGYAAMSGSAVFGVFEEERHAGVTAWRKGHRVWHSKAEEVNGDEPGDS